jgi:nucleoid DNA-binding protein
MENVDQLIQETNAKIELVVKEAFSEVKSDVLEQKKQQFDDFGRNEWDNEAWPQLQPSTIKRKAKYPHPEKPGYRTGALKNSLSVDDDLDIFSPLEYAPIIEDWINEGGSQHGFLELSDQEVDKAVEDLAQKIAEGLSNAFK